MNFADFNQLVRDTTPTLLDTEVSFTHIEWLVRKAGFNVCTLELYNKINARNSELFSENKGLKQKLEYSQSQEEFFRHRLAGTTGELGLKTDSTKDKEIAALQTVCNFQRELLDKLRIREAELEKIVEMAEQGIPEPEDPFGIPGKDIKYI